MTPNQAYLTLKQTAEYIGIKESTAKAIWPSWQRYGVIPSRFPAKGLKFKKADLDKMMESTKVIQNV